MPRLRICCRLVLAGAAALAAGGGAQEPLGTDGKALLGRALELHVKGRELLQQRRYHEAVPLAEESLAIRRKLLPAGHLDIARSLNNLGLLYEGLGLPARAVAAHEEALAIRKKALPEGHPDLAKSLNNLGAAYFSWGRYEQARQFHLQALSIRRKASPPGNLVIAYGLTHLAAANAGLGQFEEAGRSLEELLAIVRKGRPAGHPEVARVLNNLGAVYRQTSQFDKARQCYEEALAVQRRILPEGHPDLCRSWSGLAAAHAHLGRPAEAWRQALESCSRLTVFQRAVLLGTADDRRPVFNDPRLALRHLLAQAETDRKAAEQRLGDLFRQVLAQKGLGGVTLRLRREAELCDGEETARAQYSDLRQARKRLADALMGGPEPKFPERYRERCQALRQECDRLDLLLAEKVRGYAALRAADTAGAEEVSARLPPGAALVEIVLYQNTDHTDRAAEWRYVAVVLWRDAGGKAQLRLIPLGAAAPIDKVVHDWRAAVWRGGLDAKQEEGLRRAVWDSLAAVLPRDVRRLLVAPEGDLVLLPFEAIRLADGQFLIERFPIQYLTSGLDLLLASSATPRAQAGTAVLLTDPAFDSTEGRPGFGAQKAHGFPLVGRVLHFGRLGDFAAGAAVAGRLLAKQPNGKVEILSGEKASEEALAQVKRPWLLYLNTHGFFPAALGPGRRARLGDMDLVDLDLSHWLDDPARDRRSRTGLALAGANRAKERTVRGLTDGLLTAREVEGLDLWGTELVVLAAWDTGREEIQFGEGMAGLRSALQQAGARTVVAALGKSTGAQSGKLLAGFLGSWLKGQGTAEALRQAQLEIIRELRQGDHPVLRSAPPLYWASFICYGPDR